MRGVLPPDGGLTGYGRRALIGQFRVGARLTGGYEQCRSRSDSEPPSPLPSVALKRRELDIDLPAIGSRRLGVSANQEDTMLKFKVDGMTCGHCAQTVTKAVEALPRVERAVVDLKAGEVTVQGDADEGAVRQAIEDAGYDVRNAA